jgi:16S rRNA C967 or C1407 C5-methylase (RsmB/RsmF family)/NOL1/NOP2/fmu family ribosome biogenesis protein
MRQTLGSEWKPFAAAHESDSPTSIRIHPDKFKKPSNAPIPWTSFGQYLPERPQFTLDPSFHAGAYYVQEASSMFLEQAVRQSVDLRQSLRVLDLCAAPGGKSTHLLSLISKDSLLVANEVIQSRATVLSENVQKWGYPNALVTSNDPGDFGRVAGYFDLMVVDAPCSGEGLFRKDADAMKEWSPEHVGLCAARQRRILSDVWPALKEGGILIYCTCTYNAEENEDNLSWLQGQQGLESVSLKTEDSWGVQEVVSGKITGYHFYPHRVQGEGFFLAVVRKKGAADTVRTKSKFSFATPPAKAVEQVNHWVVEPTRFRFILQDDLILMLPAALATDIAWLSERLRMFNKGTAIAALKHEKLVPEHAAAMSTELSHEFFTREPLSKDLALAYLRKDNLMLGEGKRGFALVTYEDLPLGWVNLLGTRINNLYPAGWRIRMMI